MKDIVKGIYELAKPNNISINLVRGDPREKVNLNLIYKFLFNGIVSNLLFCI